jgi:tight adherence protein C
MDLAYVVIASVFLTTMLASYWLYLHLSSRETFADLRRRIDVPSVPRAAQPGSADSADLWPAKLRVLLEWLGKANKPKDAAEVSTLKQVLVTAGYRQAQAPMVFLGAQLFCALAAIGSLTLILPALVGKSRDGMTLMQLYLGAAAAGYYGPKLWLRMAVNGRKQSILSGFSDALDLMVVCMEAGLGLDMAISRVGEEIKFAHKALGEEFQLIALELRTGVARSEALRNLSRRVQLDEVNSLVALLIQADRFGTSVGQALRVHSESMKVSRSLRAEKLAAELPVKMLFPLLLFIFPCVFIVVVGPAAISMIHTLQRAFGK